MPDQLEKAAQGGTGANQHTEQSGQNVHLKTAERLAQEHNIDEKTIRRDAKYAEAIDTIAEIAGHDVRQAILTGEINSGTADGSLCRLARAPPRRIPQTRAEFFQPKRCQHASSARPA